MATVPFQTTTTQELAAGSAVQFSSTSVEPVRDTVGDDSERMSKALRNVSQAAFAIQDERDDAESKALASEFHAALKVEQAKYKNLKGVQAVAPVEIDGKKLTQLDVFNNKNSKELFETYGKKASNGKSKKMFETIARSYIRSYQANNITHSLEQQRLYKEASLDASIKANKAEAIHAYKTYANPNGDFTKYYTAGLQQVEELAVLKGWNIDPTKGVVSSQFLNYLSDYNYDVAKKVVKNFRDDKDAVGYKFFMKDIKPILNKELGEKLESSAEETFTNNDQSKKVQALFSFTGDQNSGDFLTNVGLSLTLSSNNSFEDGKGACVIDCFHSDEYETINRKTSENIENIEQIRGESIFFNPESKKRLIPQHHPTHMFAAQVLDVKKADSLYTKAKSSLDIDPQRFKDDPKYAKEMNAKIIEKYNTLIYESAEKKYSSNQKVSSLFPGTDAYKEAEKSRIYLDKIKNDLEVIRKGINYDYDPSKETVKIDFKSGLPPLEVLKERFRDTTKDPKELKYGLETLEIEYNKIVDVAEGIYSEGFDKAIDVAFAVPGGWENLSEYGIDIDNFTEEDQKILKDGPPDESNDETVAELERNPVEIRDNLKAYRPELSSSQYAQLQEYAKSLQSEAKIIAVSGDVDMLNAKLDDFNLTDLYTAGEGKKKAKQYLKIKRAWDKEMDYMQQTLNRKLSYTEKENALEKVLLDNVKVENWWGSPTKNIHFVDKDRLDDVYVQVENFKGEKVNVYPSEIKPGVKGKIMESLRTEGVPVTTAAIAQLWEDYGRPETIDDAHKWNEKLDKEKK